ncbi:BTB/POZ protein [Rhizophagus irregularis DAOM 181602=DAOM 197198]|uniref:BTB domain-containing protein n=1 Tax=Rhizophagus irregularis (strain DAOM 181602 / DAOM 197198 / MUCL 43194) TaxID=747089 RepID=U9U461_RHIID|nr:BTB/POZ protein [Rhizophagus irregularis DAOM 181602=DAOM 197198]
MINLNCRSPYLQRILSTKKKSDDGALVHIKLTNISPDVFDIILKKLLVSLIQNKNAQMREVQIWEHVIKWGLAQNPKLPSNTKEFTKDQFINLENALQHIIPLIKFREMNSKEFSKKVKPF